MYVVLYHFLGGGATPDRDGLHRFFYFGGYAVDLFFILSGFILNWVYLSNAQTMNWPAYWRARAARILPLYYLTTLLAIPGFVRSNASTPGLGAHGYLVDCIWNVFLFSGAMDGWHSTFNGPAWSISVEFFCYLALFPWLVWLHGRLSVKPNKLWFFGILAGLFTGGLVVSYGIRPIPIWHWHWDCSWLMRGISGFSAGFCLGSIHRESSRWKPGFGVINLAVLTPISILILVGFGFLPAWLGLCVLPILVLFSAKDRGVASNLLQMKFFQWLGDRSYSIYLWHVIILGSYTGFLRGRYSQPACFVVEMFLILGVSELSYRFFECPFREYIRKFPRPFPSCRFNPPGRPGGIVGRG